MVRSESSDDDPSPDGHTFFPGENVVINLATGRGRRGRLVLGKRSDGSSIISKDYRYAILYGYRSTDRVKITHDELYSGCVVSATSGDGQSLLHGQFDTRGSFPMQTKYATRALGLTGTIVGTRTQRGLYPVLLNDGTILFVHELYLRYYNSETYSYVPDNWYNKKDWWGPGKDSGPKGGGAGGAGGAAGLAASRRRMAEELMSLDCWKPSSDELRRNRRQEVIEEQQLPLNEQSAIMYLDKVTMLENCDLKTLNSAEGDLAQTFCENSMDFDGKECVWSDSRCSVGTADKFSDGYDMVTVNNLKYSCNNDSYVGLHPLADSESCSDISPASDGTCVTFYDSNKGIRCKYDSSTESCVYQHPSDYSFQNPASATSLNNPYSPYVCWAMTNADPIVKPMASDDVVSVGDDTKACNKLGNTLYNLSLCDFDTDNTYEKCMSCFGDEAQRASDMLIYGPKLAMESDNCSNSPNRFTDIQNFCTARTNEMPPVQPSPSPITPIPEPAGGGTFNCPVFADPVRCNMALPFGCYWSISDSKCKNFY